MLEFPVVRGIETCPVAVERFVDFVVDGENELVVDCILYWLLLSIIDVVPVAVVVFELVEGESKSIVVPNE